MNTEFRRKAPRRDFNGHFGTLYKGKMILTLCAQLGEGGALIESKESLNDMVKGDEIVATFFLPNIGGVVASAQCVYRSDDNKIGLQFNDLDMSHKVRIREFVSRRKKSEIV